MNRTNSSLTRIADRPCRRLAAGKNIHSMPMLRVLPHTARAASVPLLVVVALPLVALALVALAAIGPVACHHNGTSRASRLPEVPKQEAAVGEPVFPDEFAVEWKLAGRSRRFVGQDLFNHIDGAAELFIEMGFREVVVGRYHRGDAALDLEVYEMEEPTAARSIYLRFRGKGTLVPGVLGRNFGNRYQITVQKDKYFVQVNNFSGDERYLSAMVHLTNHVLNTIPDDREVVLLDLLPQEGLVPGSQFIVRGPCSLQDVFTLGEGDILQLVSAAYGVGGHYQTESEGSFTRLIVPYGKPVAAQATYHHLLQHLDPYLQVVRRNAVSYTHLTLPTKA